ncbi:MAG: DUF115 domain-containing protein [Spirochaetales bacterium]|nr:DUF115 domain-containing protein [Spirochaetales bacterium]
MADRGVLERNLLALAASDPALGVRLSQTAPAAGVTVQLSRSGRPVPVRPGPSRPLAYHSLVDPEREARRSYEAAGGAGYVVFLGLGGGYQLRPHIAGATASRLLVLEPDIAFVRAILEHIDIREILLDRRVRLCIGQETAALRDLLLSDYLPAVHGDLRTVPLRPSIDAHPEYFREAVRQIQEVIGLVADDYTVQAKFGQKWFVNTLANLPRAQDSLETLPPVHRAIVTGAGPSLELYLERLPQLRKGALLIACDTSLPALLAAGVSPDLVVSIDCQQVSYHHFLQGVPPEVPLVLDLASPSVLTRLTRRVLFFSSGHPFSLYASRNWRNFPVLDTSGGNVAHAAVSLALLLGAREISLVGIDFSYPGGKAYCRGTYLYPLFRSREHRLSPLEGQFLSFIFMNTTIGREQLEGGIRYTTRPLIGYKRRLEKSLEAAPARVLQLPGLGVPLELAPGPGSAPDRPATSALGGLPGAKIRAIFSAGPQKSHWREFLRGYLKDLQSMPLPPPQGSPGSYLLQLGESQRGLWATLLPAAAALRERNPQLRRDPARLLREVLDWSITAVRRAADR